MANPYFTIIATATLLLIATSVEASTTIAEGPISSIWSNIPADPTTSSRFSKLRTQIACTRRLLQGGGDEHCMAVLLNTDSPEKLIPDRNCCMAMADLDQEAPECWDYLIAAPFRDNHLLSLNELCVARSLA